MKGHVPVLLEQVLEQLRLEKDGLYVDCTFGRGGHTRQLLARLGEGGRVFALDRDPDAVRVGRELAEQDKRLTVTHGNFARLGSFVAEQGATGDVDGVLLDLGVSSPQLDNPERGFSFRNDGPLDMRMDPGQGQSASDWLNSADERSIKNVLYQFGEERAAPRIARAIIRQRELRPIASTADLAGIVESVVRRKPGAKHPATKTFQALRIFINAELQALESALGESLECLRPGGRLVVISFHSLEDRIVKRFLRDHSRVDPKLSKLPSVPAAAMPRLSLPVRAIRPTDDEVADNPRARSATLRVGEKL